MKRLLGALGMTLVLTSCTVMEPEQRVTVSETKHKPVRPFRTEMVVEKPAYDDGTKRVALLLPLSGQHKQLGQAMLHAAEMAVFDVPQSAPVVLLPKDTHGSVEGAHKAATDAMNEGANIILGPVFSKEVGAVKALARSKNVPVLAFTTDKQIAGGGTYALGFLPSQQVKHITRYASHQGHHKIVALTPKNEYGQILSQSLQEMRQNGEINLVDVLRYAHNQLHSGSPTMQEVVVKLKAAEAQGATAILFPEAGMPLTTFVSVLQANGLHNYKVLGTGQWDTPDISRTAGLNGAWFAAPSPEYRGNFESTYRRQFGQEPPRISTLAYDATALAIALAPHGYDRSTLTSSQGYSGLDGLFRLRPDGTTERGLAILEVSREGLRTLSPAAQTF